MVLFTVSHGNTFVGGEVHALYRALLVFVVLSWLERDTGIGSVSVRPSVISW